MSTPLPAGRNPDPQLSTGVRSVVTVHVYGDPTLWLQLSVEIGDERAKTLAAGVAASGSLAELYLTSNGIGNEGAKSLAAGVAASRSMKTLASRPGPQQHRHRREKVAARRRPGPPGLHVVCLGPRHSLEII